MRRLSWRPAIAIAVAVAAIVAGSTLAVELTTGGSQSEPVGTSVPASGQVTARATTVRLVSPLDATGRLRPGYRVAATGRGYCWTSSLVNGRLYRCMQGNSILDPCWKVAGQRAVACLPEPWSTRVVKVHLRKALPETSTSGPTLWGLRVDDGVRVNCLVSMGASGAIGHRPISFLCEHHWVLVGSPDQDAPLWQMTTARWNGRRYAVHGTEPLSTAWKAILP